MPSPTPTNPSELQGAFELMARIVRDTEALQGLIDMGIMRESVGNMLDHYASLASELEDELSHLRGLVHERLA